MGRRRRHALLSAGFLAVLLTAGVVSAQRFGGFGSFREGTFPTLWAPATMPEASFTFCRLAYRSVRRRRGLMSGAYRYSNSRATCGFSTLPMALRGRDSTGARARGIL